MKDECDRLECPYYRDGRCAEISLKDPYKQTGCVFYDGKNINGYPKDEGCKFCINRWTCKYKDTGVCER